MADIAHTKTDQKLEEMEKRLSAIYSRANKEIGKRWKEYLAESQAEIDELQKAYELAKKGGDAKEIRKAGKKLASAKRERTLMDKRFKDLTEATAAQLANVNKTALAYVNGQLPEVYSINYNALEPSVDGVGGYSFALIDEDTVKNLATTDKSLLPYKQLDEKTDIRWNVKKLNAEVLQGILQGEPMDKIAGRLSKVTGMNETAAIRNARTMVTGAENKGRQDSYARASADGIILAKEWISTNDSRTRHSHAVLDGSIVDQDKKFENGLMFPGDPNGRPEETWNCRCTVAAVVKGFKKAQVQKAMEGEGTALNGDKYAMNPKDINGVTRGEAMSFEDADGKAGNPKYRKGTGTAQNCQSCVVANEARRRGYNVSAKSYTKNKTAEVLAQNPRVAWVDPKTGDVPDFVPWDYKRTYDKKSYRAFLDDNVKVGERYTLQFNWRNASGGHIISAERDSRGALRLYDPQTGKIYDKDWALDDLMGRMSYTDKSGRSDPPKLLRIDNLAFREDVAKDILEEGAKVWKPTDDMDDWIPF